MSKDDLWKSLLSIRGYFGADVSATKMKEPTWLPPELDFFFLLGGLNGAAAPNVLDVAVNVSADVLDTVATDDELDTGPPPTSPCCWMLDTMSGTTVAAPLDEDEAVEDGATIVGKVLEWWRSLEDEAADEGGRSVAAEDEPVTEDVSW